MGTRRVLRACALACAFVLALCGAAVAGGDSVHIAVSQRVRAGSVVHLRVFGNARTHHRLTILIDTQPCAATAHAEAHRASSTGLTIAVRGRFSQRAHTPQSSRGSTHWICAYLWRGKPSRRGPHASATYRAAR